MLRDQANQAEFPREFLGVSLPEESSKYYFIVEADSSIQMIMENLQAYKFKLSFYFEGFQYQLGDFRVRVGKVVPAHAETVRGIVMEVEYLPISSIEMARKVMEEFLEILQEAMSKRLLPGKFVNIELNFEKFGLGDNYTPQHTAIGYAFFMAHLMAIIQAGRG
ncbi:unnamed protein product [Arabidopsis halleri]